MLPCKQHHWTLGTYSIEISTRVSKHVVLFLNFPCLIASHMFTVLLAYVYFSFLFSLVLWLRICVAVDVDSSPIAHEAEDRMGY